MTGRLSPPLWARCCAARWRRSCGKKLLPGARACPHKLGHWPNVRSWGEPDTPGKYQVFTRFIERLLTSRRLYIELTVIEIGALESHRDAVEAARARGVSVGARARENCIDPVRLALLEFPGEARGD